jgi:phosphatidate cytidylyltransferase
MALNMPTFYKRLASSLVFVAVMLFGLLWNDWAFLALVCLINCLCLRDYFRLMQKIDTESHWPVWLPLTFQLISVFLICLFSIKTNYPVPAILWSVGAFLPVVPALLILAGTLAKKQALPALAQSIFGLFYITLPMILLPNMHMHDFVLPVALIFLIWSNDTLAYLVGSFIGKTPFSPISPKKTWEGTIGGALLTIIAAGLYGHFSHTYRLADWIALALCAAVAGTFGDLLESKLKRMADVKDSGALMPGHGGALDRFDSLLVATPFAFVYIISFMR